MVMVKGQGKSSDHHPMGTYGRLLQLAAPLVVGAAVVGAACTLPTVDETVRNAAGDVIQSGAVGILALEVGDCFNDPPGLVDSDEEFEIETVTAVPCDEPHDNQAYAEFDLPDGDWPGRQATTDAAFDGCLDRFESMIGERYATSPLDILPLSPTEEGWRQGDHEVLCSVYNVDLSKLTADVISPGA